MKSHIGCLLAIVTCHFLDHAALASERVILATDLALDRISVLSASTGELIESDFITNTAGGAFTFQSPVEALPVGDEIWVSDQVADAIFRFDRGGRYKSTLSGKLDNIRGMALHNGVVYVANSGTGNSAPGPALARFTPAGTRLDDILTASVSGSPFDVLSWNGKLLVSDLSSDDINIFDDAGFVSAFVDSTNNQPINGPLQLYPASDGTVWAAGSLSTQAFYQFNASGQLLRSFADSLGPRGIVELDTGLMAYTVTGVVKRLDPSNGTAITTWAPQGASFRFLSHAVIPEPTTSLTALAAVCLLLRRRPHANA